MTIPKKGDVGVRVLFVLVTVLCCAVLLGSKCQDRGQCLDNRKEGQWGTELR
jgi:hypothetical protein